MTEADANPEESGVEEIVDDTIDLEEYAKLGKRPPLAKGYRIRVNGEPFVVADPTRRDAKS